VLRVLHLASGDGWGGAERVLSVLAATPSQAYRAEALLLNEGQLAETLRAGGMQVHILPETEQSFFSLLGETRRFVAAAEPDAVHAHRYKEILLAIAATWGRATGIVITVHGLEGLRALGLLRATLLWGSAALARAVGARFATVSPELQQRLSRWFGSEHVVEIPNPMPEASSLKIPAQDDNSKWPATPPERTKIGFIGRLEIVKGPDRFLDLAEACPADWAFVLIGDGSMRAELEKSVQERGLEGRVFFRGAVADATPYMAELDALAVTSRHEGTPMVLLEAAGLEKPTVAFDVGGIRSAMKGAPESWLAPDGDVGALATQLQALLSDHRQAQSDAAAWKREAESKYSRDSVANEYAALYAGVSSRPSRS